MRLTEEQVQRLLKLRKVLQERIRKLRKTLELYEEVLKTIDTILRSGSIMTADQYLEVYKAQEAERQKCFDVIEEEDHISIKLKFNIKKDDTQFRKYVKERLLEKFKREDLERVREGEIDQEYAFDYEITTRENMYIDSIKLWNCDNIRLEKILQALEKLCRQSSW